MSTRLSHAQRPGHRAEQAAAAVFLLTVGQLAVATFVPGLPQFEGKAFGARLLFYPCLMAIVPVACWLVRRRTGASDPLPWTACAFVMAPFLVDVTGNTLDFYDSLWWWDDANHFVNWLLLSWGLGLLVARLEVHPRWLLVITITGLGALLAIVWELGEWYTFIRHGTELGTAYEDTLSDETLGTLGAFVAGLVVTRSQRSRRLDRRTSAPAR
ncbi:MAG: hypothetical protein WKF54_05540 [Nocardioidaceae bacterium]